MREMLWRNGKQGDSGIGKWVSCRFSPSGRGGFDLGNEKGSAALSNWSPLLYSLPGVVPTSQVAMAISVCASRGWRMFTWQCFRCVAMVNEAAIVGLVAWWPGRCSSVLAPAPAASHTCAQERQHQQDPTINKAYHLLVGCATRLAQQRCRAGGGWETLGRSHCYLLSAPFSCSPSLSVDFQKIWPQSTRR